MSYTITASGHVAEQPGPSQPAPGGTGETTAEVEADLAVRLHDVLSRPAFGCGKATFYGQHIGQVDLLAGLTPAVSLDGRHPGTTALLAHFEYGHLPQHLAVISRKVGDLAREMVRELPDGAELTTGLRKLLEAKDCLVRAAAEQYKAPAGDVPDPPSADVEPRSSADDQPA
jgi:hypothetical protein